VTFAGVSYLAVLIAAIAGWGFGALWYGLLGKEWMAAAGLTKDMIAPEGRGPSPTPFVLSFLAELVMAFVLAGVIGHLGAVTIRNGVIAALLIWAGFVATTILVNNAYQMKPYRLSAIDAGHWLGVLLIMGAFIGLWGA
jgi:hypothetical protein